MTPGLYSFRTRGFDGVDWPVGGVAILQNGVVLGGGPYTYFTGSYSSEGGIFKAELILNEHMRPPPDHVFYNAKDVGIGVRCPARHCAMLLHHRATIGIHRDD
jgi:hypothetical protein